MPGEIFVKNFQFTIPVLAGSANAWKKAIKQSYPNVIIGSQKAAANLNMKVEIKTTLLIFNQSVATQGTKGRGTRHVIYWKHTNEAGVQPLKVNLIVYENDILQVSKQTKNLYWTNMS